MKILFIAPIPPPITGNSLAAKVFLDELCILNKVEIINVNKSSLYSGVNSLGRIKQILSILKNVWIKNRNTDFFYFTISESFAGNIKDLIIYLICYKKLKYSFIHMLGGAGIKSIVEKKGFQFRLNKFFISKLKGVVVEGLPQANTFSNLISKQRIHIVQNFAEDFLFINEDEINLKFDSVNPLKILFLSNLLYGKGHNELADAYISLSDELKDRIRITYIGGFETDKDKNDFLKKIDSYEGLNYYGKFIGGEEKKAKYCESHIFCLPTYYPYEGQPISILEAYATGCLVITTMHSGIPEIFEDKINGYAVDKKSSESIKKVLENMIDKKVDLLKVAISNRNLAFQKYRTTIFTSSLIKIIENNKNFI